MHTARRGKRADIELEPPWQPNLKDWDGMISAKVKVIMNLAKYISPHPFAEISNRSQIQSHHCPARGDEGVPSQSHETLADRLRVLNCSW